ncbi:troponin C isoform X1 [Dendroctonus ponderosae]|uniref:EF-hand domain-containing protein n=1 Tax=Dendroctonus ponderosae TaxID=77166 RepID=A0AAR5PS86_DENPD|nr:troponin C isoform X1 [Dendroctonus ponderosae]XP_048518906.1 troponin C isoform X1 [Dendroctonus ponderosae]
MFDGYFEQMTMQPEGERSLRAGFRQVPIRKRLQDQFDQCEDAQKPHGAEPASRCLRQLVRSFRSMRITVTDLRQDELPAEQIAVLRKAFEAFDSQKSGSIPCDMVADILRLMGQPFDKRILEELIDEVDADKSGRLEFEEFVTLAAKFIVEEDDEAMQKELKEAFRLYDKEGNGYIPTSCLREILRELDDQLTDRELDMMIEEIDTDGSGTVDFDEFMEMMTGEV